MRKETQAALFDVLDGIAPHGNLGFTYAPDKRNAWKRKEA